jgi:hypothetical protein
MGRTPSATTARKKPRFMWSWPSTTLNPLDAQLAIAPPPSLRSITSLNAAPVVAGL